MTAAALLLVGGSLAVLAWPDQQQAEDALSPGSTVQSSTSGMADTASSSTSQDDLASATEGPSTEADDETMAQASDFVAPGEPADLARRAADGAGRAGAGGRAGARSCVHGAGVTIARAVSGSGADAASANRAGSGAVRATGTEADPAGTHRAGAHRPAADLARSAGPDRSSMTGFPQHPIEMGR